MSAIYLNLSDVRNLLVAMGQPRPEKFEFQDAMEVISRGLGVSRAFLLTYMELPSNADHAGLWLTRRRLVDLAASLVNSDTSSMKNTQRLDMVGAVFDRKPDALMHSLKHETANLGHNPSLDTNLNPMPAKSLRRLSLDHKDEWFAALGRAEGLYVIFGTPWAVRSVADPSMYSSMTHYKANVLAVQFEDFDRYSGTAEWKTKIHEAIKPLLKTAPFLHFNGARNTMDMEIAIEYARKVPTLVTAHSERALVGMVSPLGRPHPLHPMPATILHVAHPNGDEAITSALSSKIEFLNI